MGRREGPRRPSAAPRPSHHPLHRLLQRRVRAARDLGVPGAAVSTAPGAPVEWKVAQLERRIAEDLERSGGKHLPPWEEIDEDEDGDDAPLPFSPPS